MPFAHHTRKAVGTVNDQAEALPGESSTRIWTRTRQPLESMSLTKWNDQRKLRSCGSTSAPGF